MCLFYRSIMTEINIGKIVNVVGLKGEVKVYNYSDYKERYEELDHIYLYEMKKLKEYKIEKVRYQKEMVILKLKGIDDRDMAEKMKNRDIFILEEDLRPLSDDTFYIKDMIGIDAIEAQSGQVFGKLTDVIQNSAQDIYQITLKNGKEALIPAVKEFIKEINIDEGFVKIALIPGFIDADYLTVEKDN